VNFTREPIIETIITPKEGCKLVVRSTKTEGQEEYMVDAVEVISFGQALFFRNLEKPKSFLVPVGDYEVVEVKETRAVLKNAQFERSIKIGGGRDASIRREPVEEVEEEASSPASLEEESGDPATQEAQFERRRDRRRHRRRRPSEERAETPRSSEPSEAKSEAPSESVQHFTSLIPPPTTLISETIGKYKEQQQAHQAASPEEPKRDEPDAGPSALHRVASEGHAFQTTQTNFSSDWTNFLS
jgi:hypothetical protein